jgi:hypothetical protein
MAADPARSSPHVNSWFLFEQSFAAFRLFRRHGELKSKVSQVAKVLYAGLAMARGLLTERAYEPTAEG